MLKWAHGPMKLLSRVVWSEGMYLGPHHLQVQGRYFEDSIQFATSSLWFAAYGLAGVELDADALHNGTLSLLHARGIFPDGLPFNMPEGEAPPPAPRRPPLKRAEGQSPSSGSRHRGSVPAHPRRRHRPAGHTAAQAQRAELLVGR